MSWLDRLVEASYEGVTFLTEDQTTSGGWRIALHEYPFRDDPYPENMGKKAYEPSFNAYFIGENYDQQAMALHEKLDTFGTGRLVHPVFGTMTVQLEDWQRKEVTAEGGICRYSLKFIQSGKQRLPTTAANPLAEIKTANDNVWGALDNSFLEDYRRYIEQAGGEFELAQQLEKIKRYF